MRTLINPLVRLASARVCKASREAVALGAGSVAVSLVGSLEACSKHGASIRLAAVARVWLHWVWLLAEGLSKGIFQGL